jgi:hypothetical protein
MSGFKGLAVFERLPVLIPFSEVELTKKLCIDGQPL